MGYEDLIDHSQLRHDSVMAVLGGKLAAMAYCRRRRLGAASRGQPRYHVPVSADVPSLEAILVEEADPYVNTLGSKGVGEIGITGTAGAIDNAVRHATGVRVRRFPIRIEQLIGTATA